MRGNLRWGGQQRKWTRASCLSQLHTAVTPGHGTDFLPRPVCPRDWGLSSRAARSRPPAHPSRASDDRGKGAGEEARACGGGGSSRIQALRLRVHSCFLGTDPQPLSWVCPGDLQRRRTKPCLQGAPRRQKSVCRGLLDPGYRRPTCLCRTPWASRSELSSPQPWEAGGANF